jgi:hypothetical protein
LNLIGPAAMSGFLLSALVLSAAFDYFKLAGLSGIRSQGGV